MKASKPGLAPGFFCAREGAARSRIRGRSDFLCSVNGADSVPLVARIWLFSLFMRCRIGARIFQAPAFRCGCLHRTSLRHRNSKHTFTAALLQPDNRPAQPEPLPLIWKCFLDVPYLA